MSFWNVISLMRVHQWVKNLFILLPAFFGQQLSEHYAVPLFLSFLSFSLAASSVYVFNDVIDLGSDKLHPKKSKRPLASGALSIPSALVLAFCLVLMALTVAYFVHTVFLVACVVYIIQNLLYSIWLKNIPLVDVTVISMGFLIRLFAGGAVTDVPVSNWMYIMTFLLAMMLALGKRRDDLLILERKGIKLRRVSDGYSINFIDHLSVMLGGVITVSYIMYTLTPDIIQRVGSPHVYITSIFVFLGVLRYLQLELVVENSGNPTLILIKDKPTLLIVIAWITTFGYLLYF